jgi:hypothetical protein
LGLKSCESLTRLPYNEWQIPVRSRRDNRGRHGVAGQGFQGGHGRGRFQGRQGRSMNSKQLDIKLFPHGIRRETQTVTYDAVKDHIVQYIEKTYEHGQDIAVSLRDLTKKDLTSLVPTRGHYTVTDPIMSSNEQSGMDIMYQAELGRYLERKDTLEQNLTKSYALIFSTYTATRWCRIGLKNIRNMRAPFVMIP